MLQQPPPTLENKEIRGVTIKQLIVLFGFLSSILITVVLTYASITNKLDGCTEALRDMKNAKETQALQIDAIKDQLKAIEIRLVQLETQVKAVNTNQTK